MREESTRRLGLYPQQDGGGGSSITRSCQAGKRLVPGVTLTRGRGAAGHQLSKVWHEYTTRTVEMGDSV